MRARVTSFSDPPMTRLFQTMAGARHGGAEAFFERLAIALHEVGLAQRLAIRRDERRSALLREAGLDLVELPFGGPLDLYTTFRLKRDIAGFAPDVVLSWMSRATAKTPAGDYVLAARLGGYYDLKYFRHADHLIGNTPGIVDYIVAQGWPAARTHYLPNFVEAAPGRRLPRGGFETPEEAPVVLALGRLHANKAFDVLIRALAGLDGVFLWIAGSGPEEAALKALADSDGVAARVRFLGWRDDTADLLASADLLVCPSRHEPLGNVVIEGWAHGLPVVAADSDGPRHLVREGDTGLLVPREDAAALAAAIARVVADKGLAAALAAAGRAEYAARFSKEIVVARYLEFFRAVRK